jgi:hypothetical protein
MLWVLEERLTAPQARAVRALVAGEKLAPAQIVFKLAAG